MGHRHNEIAGGEQRNDIVRSLFFIEDEGKEEAVETEVMRKDETRQNGAPIPKAVKALAFEDTE